ncbi:MAG: DUF1080 domain-containing protein [bacterium]|nr:DUF1080 domain-containing protein [bacterium]
MTWTVPVVMTVALVLLCGAAPAAETKPPISPTEPTALFNGRDLDGFYTFVRDRGRDSDPKKVFTVEDGMIRISGEEYGCITSNDEYRDYRLIVEFKWGDETFAPRIDRARDSGILLHSVGEDGAFGGVWMNSIECQVIEGGTGDFIVVGDGSEDYAITCPVAKEKCLNAHVYQPDGDPVTVHSGRVNWFARDPDWEDSKGYRGKDDVEKPLGEWNRVECIADKDTITVFLNGVKVNACTNARPSAGRIQVQSEGAEIYVRKVELLPLKKGE